MSDYPLLQIVLYLNHRLELAQKRGDLGISLSQYRVLYWISEGPAKSVELAAASGMTKPSIGSLVTQLEGQGWVERHELEHDKRAASIRITDAGRKMLAHFEAEMNTALEVFLGADHVSKADAQLAWLDELVLKRRDEVHAEWALRNSKDNTDSQNS